MDTCYELVENNLNTAESLVENLIFRLKVGKLTLQTIGRLRRIIKSINSIYKELLYNICYQPTESCKECVIELGESIHKREEEILEKIFEAADLMQEAFSKFFLFKLVMSAFVLPLLEKTKKMADDFDVVVSSLQADKTELLSKEDLLNSIS